MGTTGIILMGGTGERFGSALPKQFHRLSSKKIYQYTLEQFLKVSHFDTIILVCPEQHLEQTKIEVACYSDPRVQVILGGCTRQESSYLALLACAPHTQYVVIHDGVRPFVSQEILLQNLREVACHGAVDTCIPSADTIVHAEKSDTIASIPKRSDYLRGQTPQSFFYPLILHAHRRAREMGIQNASDDCSLVLELGHPVKIVPGAEENIKITTELDLLLAEQLFRIASPPPLSKNLTSLQGKRFAITGGTGGIGQAIAQKLEEEGAVALLVSPSSVRYPADLTSPLHAERIFSQLRQEHGPLDGLINSLGALTVRAVSALFPEEIESLIATNLTGLIYSCKYVQIKEGGHIVNIASSSYLRGKKEYAIYASTKAAVVNFTQGLAEERPELHVNVVVPQRTNTPMRRLNFPEEDTRTLLEPEQVAHEIVNILKTGGLTGTITEVRKDLPA